MGAAWFQDGSYYDSERNVVRSTPEFKWWDSDADRLQDARGSYGAGFQFLFLGGLQFNWAWSHRMDYTRFVVDPSNPFGDLLPVEADTSGSRFDFYIVYDF